MKTLNALLVLVLLGVAGGVGFIYSGVYNIAADAPHWPATHRLIAALRDHSIAARSGDIPVPPDLAHPERARRGAGNYDAMCVGCHLAPGLKDSEIRKGLYPQPPNLAMAAESGGTTTASAARQFWVIKHGLKMTGMPAWSKGGVDDATIWDIVALLQKLPQMSPDEYRALVAASAGHTHAGAEMQSHDRDAAPSGHADAPGAPPYHHGDAAYAEPGDQGPSDVPER
jgi:hypothetical protein